jgi:hypothetical protein
MTHHESANEGSRQLSKPPETKEKKILGVIILYYLNMM